MGRGSGGQGGQGGEEEAVEATGPNQHRISTHLYLVHLCQALKQFVKISPAIFTKKINRNYIPILGRWSASL